MNIRTWKKAAASLLGGLLLATSQAQAARQIGQAVSSRPGETIPAISARGMGSLGSPDATPAALSLSASPAGNPADLAPAPGLPSKNTPSAQPRPETTAGQTPVVDNTFAQPSLQPLSGLGQPAQIEGHAVAAAQTAATNPRPARRRLQFRLSRLFSLTLITALALGLRQSHLHDTKSLEEPIRWQQKIGPALKGLAEELDPPNPVERSQAEQYESFLSHINKINEEVYRTIQENDPSFHSSSRANQLKPILDLRALVRNRPTAWTQEELDELFRQYASPPFKRYYRRDEQKPEQPYPYLRRELEFAARIHKFHLEVRQDPRRSANASQVYLDFLREVKLKDPHLYQSSDEEHPRNFSTRARRILDVVNSLDARQRWLKIKHGLLAAFATMIAVTPLAWLSRGVKSIFSGIKKSAARSESTSLMGAAVFMLPDSMTISGSWGWLWPYIVAGVAGAIAGTAMLIKLRREHWQFSIWDIGKAILVIALTLTFYRSYASDLKEHADELNHAFQLRQVIGPELQSLADAVTPKEEPLGNDFNHFLIQIGRIQFRISDRMYRDEGIPILHVMSDAIYNRAFETFDIGNKPTSWSEKELEALDRKLEAAFQRGDPASYEPSPFSLRQRIAATHAFFLKVREDPKLRADPQEVYKRFIRELELSHSRLGAILEKHSETYFQEVNSIDQKSIKQIALGALLWAATALLYGLGWLKRKAKAAFSAIKRVILR